MSLLQHGPGQPTDTGFSSFLAQVFADNAPRPTGGTVGFSQSLSANVGAPSLQGLSTATHTDLMNAGNSQYMKVIALLSEAQNKLTKLGMELELTQKLKDDLLKKIPDVLAASPSTEHDCVRKPLGFGLEAWPTGIPADKWETNYPDMQWYTELQYKAGRPRGKKGAHKNTDNTAQTFMEDEVGQVASGEVAKGARDYVEALLDCLRIFGQATSSFEGLDAMSRGFLYANLLKRYPFLGLCDNGTWKLDMLIKQKYSNWAKKHGLTKTSPSKSAKSRATPALDAAPYRFEKASRV